MSREPMLEFEDLLQFAERSPRFHRDDAEALWLCLVNRSLRRVLDVKDERGARVRGTFTHFRQVDGKRVTRASLLKFGEQFKDMRVGATGYDWSPRFFRTLHDMTVNGRALLLDWMSSMDNTKLSTAGRRR
jgi:hypothetical protein